MGMADDYYIQKDEPEFECVSCDGPDDDCPVCGGDGVVGSEAICDTCDCYPCRCDHEYDSWRDAQLEW